jgi:hypothetical protein
MFDNGGAYVALQKPFFLNPIYLKSVVVHSAIFFFFMKNPVYLQSVRIHSANGR